MLIVCIFVEFTINFVLSDIVQISQIIESMYTLLYDNDGIVCARRLLYPPPLSCVDKKWNGAGKAIMKWKREPAFSANAIIAKRIIRNRTEREKIEQN